MAEESLSTERHRAARASARQMVVDSVLWMIYELPPYPFDRRTTPSLLFESDSTIRRVRNYPATWRTLSDRELFALSWAV